MMQRKANSGFTLIELMVSIAIVVVLMVGVAQVFQYTGQAVGATQQMSDAVRNDRAAQGVFNNDFSSIATDSPILMFRSRVFPAFRGRNDLNSDPDRDPWSWEQRAADVGFGSTVFPAVQNERSHRLDRLAFMARGVFRRQTGNDGVFVAPMSSNEAFVWYGHLTLPHTNGNFYLNGASTGDKTNPGTGNFSSNPQNYFASQWILGHMAMTLLQPTGATTANFGTISVGTLQQFVKRDLSVTNLNYLAPLSVNSSAQDGSEIQRCRYDLAGTSISGYSDILKRAIGTQWQAGVSYSSGQRVYYRGRTFAASGNHTSTAANAPLEAASQWNFVVANHDWWSDLFMESNFEANPFIVKPLTSQSYSQQSPILMQGCTQFIVEYAGDFLRQDTNPDSTTYGYVLDSFENPVASPAGLPHTDGVTDFIVTWLDADGDALIDPEERASVHRDTRWYGLPRDVASLAVNGSSRPSPDGVVLGYDEGTGRRPQQLVDVVPFRDVALTIQTTYANRVALGLNPALFPANAPVFYDPTNGSLSYPGAPFEKFENQTNLGVNSLPSTIKRYLDVVGDPTNISGMQWNNFYQCAWGPYDTVRPQMIRIILTLDDPNSRFAEGQTFEYVYKLP
jgi:prepilin-type N-terminal cleavage/methylation domain-containing protein